MSVPAGMMPPPGGPPPGMGDPSMMGAPPAPPSPIDQISQGAAGLLAGGNSIMMVLAQMLGQNASPEAMGAQTSPGPLDAGPPPGAGTSPF